MHRTGIAVEVTNCENHGEIELINATSAGGIFGDITYSGLRSAEKVQISGCANYGDITVKNSGNYVAGILGRYQDVTVINGGNLEITSCSASGNITAKGCNYVAGIFGYGKGCTAVLTTLTVSGTISGNSNVTKIVALVSSCPNMENYKSSFNTDDCTAKNSEGTVYTIYVCG